MAAAALLLSGGSTGLAQQGGGLPQADSSRRVCTQQYDPVCARRGTSHRTFGNACEAQVAGYFVEYEGRCRLSRRDRDRRELQRVCTQEYDPVCAIGRGGRKTFGNACEADVAGYRTVHGGRC
ncbi:MAG: protease inhibitor [Rhizobiaceae bacterium]